MNEKILIVENNRFERVVTTAMMEKSGYVVVSVESGQNCLALIEEHQPQMVLLDIVMPGISGTDVLVEIRSKWSQIELPVIMITANNQSSDVIEALNLGANDFISKPVEFDVAKRRMETHLNIAKLSRENARGKEFEAIAGMTATYNHEINNPLTVAIGVMEVLKDNYPNDKNIVVLEENLWRISDVVKKTREVIEQKFLVFKNYGVNSKMVDIS